MITPAVLAVRRGNVLTQKDYALRKLYVSVLVERVVRAHTQFTNDGPISVAEGKN